MEYYDEGPLNPYDPVGYTVETLKALKLDGKRIGLNLRVLSAEDYQRFQTLLPKARFVDFRVERIRVRRSTRELECIRQAIKAKPGCATRDD